jgi:Zn-dependent protease with chaperone function
MKEADSLGARQAAADSARGAEAALVPLLVRFAAFILLGSAACGLAHALSGRLEPFDSGRGFLVTQAVLGTAAWFAGWRAGGRMLALMLLGAYIGVNLYFYVVGGSESRAWALLGALTSTVLLAVPALLGCFGYLIGRAGRARAR